MRTQILSKFNAILITFLFGCAEPSDAVTTEVFCDAGEFCEFEFDLSTHDQAAISARFFNEAGELECIDIEKRNFDWDIKGEIIFQPTLFLEVDNESKHDYLIFIHWIYEEKGDCWVEIM